MTLDNISKVRNRTKPHGLRAQLRGSGRNSPRGQPTALPPGNVEPGSDLSRLNTTTEESPIDPHHPRAALNDYPRGQAELGLGCGQQLRVPTSGIDFGDLFGATRCHRCLCSYLELPIFIAAPNGFCTEGLGEDFRSQTLKINHQSRDVGAPRPALPPLHSAIKKITFNFQSQTLVPVCRRRSARSSLYTSGFCQSTAKFTQKNSTVGLVTERGVLYPEKLNSIPDPS